MAMPALLVAAVYAVPALLWGTVAAQSVEYLRVSRPRGRLFRLMPLATMFAAGNAFAGMAWALAPPGIVPLMMARDATALLAVAVFRHVLCYLPAPEASPGGRWLGLHYGMASVLIATVLARDVAHPVPAGVGEAIGAAYWGYLLLQSASCLRQVARNARGTGFGVGGVVEMRRPDVLVIGVGLATALLALLAFVRSPAMSPGVRVVGEVAISIAAVVPVAVRMLGQVVRRVMVAVMTLALVGMALWTRDATRVGTAPALWPLVDLGFVLALAGILAPGSRWLGTAVDRAIFRRRQHQLAELQAFLHTLSPELGVRACCERVLAEIARVMQVPACAILLADGEAVVHGDFRIEPIAQVWPRGAAADALPAHSFGTAELRELPQALKDALTEAQVGLGVYPIISPRGRRGHLFLSTGLFNSLGGEADVQAFEVVSAQLALLLDGADLLTRTVAVERALAHAEKLAAIGELAARVAHEIRNPVTAARSLAQQLCREAGGPPDAESMGLILTELERVERQVAALLRFARREDLRRERVDLGELAHATAGSFRARCRQAGIVLDVQAEGDVMADADRERVRQVLVNLIENALDALVDAPGERRLAVQVAGRNGSARIEIRDTGPGIAPEALARVFEPFFSLKPTGTGLGLAIARRTAEAHGGTLEAANARTGGVCFTLELPLALRETVTP